MNRIFDPNTQFRDWIHCEPVPETVENISPSEYEWARYAYLAGARAGMMDMLHTLADYGTSVAGIKQFKLYTDLSQKYDDVSKDLEEYYKQVWGDYANS